MKVFDDDIIKEMFVALTILFQQKGNYKNAYSTMIKGMHRESVWVHLLFAAKFDPNGLI